MDAAAASQSLSQRLLPLVILCLLAVVVGPTWPVQAVYWALCVRPRGSSALDQAWSLVGFAQEVLGLTLLNNAFAWCFMSSGAPQLAMTAIVCSMVAHYQRSCLWVHTGVAANGCRLAVLRCACAATVLRWSVVVTAPLWRCVLQTAWLQRFWSFAPVLVLLSPQPFWWVLAHASLLLVSLEYLRLRMYFFHLCTLGERKNQEEFAAAQTVCSPTQCRLWPLDLVRYFMAHLTGKASPVPPPIPIDKIVVITHYKLQTSTRAKLFAKGMADRVAQLFSVDPWAALAWFLKRTLATLAGLPLAALNEVGWAAIVVSLTICPAVWRHVDTINLDLTEATCAALDIVRSMQAARGGAAEAAHQGQRAGGSAAGPARQGQHSRGSAAAAARSTADTQTQHPVAEAPGPAQVHPCCVMCGRSKQEVPAGSKLRRCSGCLAVYYCCKECQIQHWREGGHREVCRAP